MKNKITIGRRGVVTLPADLRKRYGLGESDALIVEETQDGILLRPSVTIPVEIYSEDRIAEFQEDDGVIGEVLDSASERPE